ncbi:MAG: hypothetical protein J4F49_01150 [Rhodobacteraceae bacterium]|nr:hypothetical protein [Paracoccaceae bacterium]
MADVYSTLTAKSIHPQLVRDLAVPWFAERSQPFTGTESTMPAGTRTNAEAQNDRFAPGV